MGIGSHQSSVPSGQQNHSSRRSSHYSTCMQSLSGALQGGVVRDDQWPSSKQLRCPICLIVRALLVRNINQVMLCVRTLRCQHQDFSSKVRVACSVRKTNFENYTRSHFLPTATRTNSMRSECAQQGRLSSPSPPEQRQPLRRTTAVL